VTSPLLDAWAAYHVSETRHLDSQPTSTEPTFYLVTKTLLSAILKEGRLPFEVRVNTSETKGKARDMPDFVLGDDKMFIGVYGEVKRANVLLEDLALSTEQNDQIGRYLARRTGGFGLLACAAGYSRPLVPCRTSGADQNPHRFRHVVQNSRMSVKKSAFGRHRLRPDRRMWRGMLSLVPASVDRSGPIGLRPSIVSHVSKHHHIPITRRPPTAPSVHSSRAPVMPRRRRRRKLRLRP
jgi:hypothetical protein